MGGTESQNKNNYKDEIMELKKDIVDHIKNYKLNNKSDVEKWKKHLIEYINSAFEKKNKKIEIEQSISNKKKENINKNIKEINEDENSKNITITKNKSKKLDFFTPKDIHSKNLEITREFENIYSDYINDNDKIENESIAKFLLEIANISRNSFNESNKFLKSLYEEYEKSTNLKQNNNINTSDQFKKEFSSWVKNKNNINENVLNYLNKIESIYKQNKENDKEKKYYNDIYKNLFTLYYQCELSIPPIEINFSHEDNYNSQNMYDILNRGKERKVNFVFLPSLYSNGNFLENGKKWVFTYTNNDKKRTFKFEDINLTSLIKAKDKFKIPTLSDRLKMDIKIKNALTVELNYNICDKINQEYRFYLKDKDSNQIKKISKKKGKIQFEKNLEFIECEFYLMGTKISSIKNPTLDSKNKNIYNSVIHLK